MNRAVGINSGAIATLNSLVDFAVAEGSEQDADLAESLKAVTDLCTVAEEACMQLVAAGTVDSKRLALRIRLALVLVQGPPA
jgi:hypothetical protein